MEKSTICLFHSSSSKARDNLNNKRVTEKKYKERKQISKSPEEPSRTFNSENVIGLENLTERKQLGRVQGFKLKTI